MSRAALALVLALLVLGNGCTRRYFRNCADKEVSAVLAEKDRFAFWKIENYHVYPDPRARFADPTDPDHPPKPPDDPSAYYLSPDPQRCPRPYVAWVEGTAYLDILQAWSDGNRAMGVKPTLGDLGQVEATYFKPNPERDGTSMVQAAYRPRDDDKPAPAVIGLGAPAPVPVEVTRANFQDASPLTPNPTPRSIGEKGEGLEMLPALPELPPPQRVDADGADSVIDSKRPSFLITLDQSVELGLFNSRDFQTRREDLYLVALPVTLQRFNFSFQWFAIENAFRQWTGPEFPGGPLNIWDTNQAVGFNKLFSTGALLLFQFANETVVHLTGGPRHTISESVVNLDLIQPLLRGGGRAVTLEPLTQAERNLLYEIRDYARFRKAFYAAVATGGDLDVLNTQPVRQGYLPILKSIAQLQLQVKNAEALRKLHAKFIEYEKGGIVNKLQVDQVKLELLKSENQVRLAEQRIYDGLDRFKIQLGLPVTIELDLANDPIQPLNQQFQRFDNLFSQFDATTKQLAKGLEAPNMRRFLKETFANSEFTRGTEFSKAILPFWAAWEPPLTDLELAKKLAERGKVLLELSEKSELTPLETERQKLLTAEVEIGELETTLRLFEAKKLPLEKLPDLMNGAILVLVQARQEKLARLLRSWPDLPPIIVAGVDLMGKDKDRAEDTVVQTALTTRLDLLNARAQVVDAWRGIRVFANALLGVIDIGYHLDSITPIGEAKPFAFSGHRSQHQIEFNAEAPLVRLLERNEYRTALIVYQRQRRLLMAAEDNIAAQVRRELRQLRVFAANYKVQQEQVALAYNQVDSSEETLAQPPAPGQVISNAGNAAALTQQVLNAQSGLLNAQQALYTIWLDYLSTRIQLYRDLELMPLDTRGVWIDELSTDEHSESDRADGQAGPPLSSRGRGVGGEGRSQAPGLLPPVDAAARVAAP